MKKIAILGSTGSIGTQTLDVISNNSNDFKVELISANSNYKLLIKQAIKYNPKTIVFGNTGEESATGVAFTRNPATGENKFFGEYA